MPLKTNVTYDISIPACVVKEVITDYVKKTNKDVDFSELKLSKFYVSNGAWSFQDVGRVDMTFIPKVDPKVTSDDDGIWET